MNLWAILLIVGTLALLIGPVAMLQPTHRERRQAKLRTKARALGLNVHLQKLPQLIEGDTQNQAMPLYVQPKRTKREWCLVRTRYAHGAHVQQWWEYSSAERPSSAMQKALDEVLKTLPSSVMGVSRTPEGLGFFWTEKGGIEQLSALSDILQRLLPHEE